MRSRWHLLFQREEENAERASGLSQSNYYYRGGVFFVCPLLLNRFRYPSSNVPI
jgi:hypothetical protein